MGILNWFERRKREKQIKRDMTVRRGQARIKRHIAKQRAASKQLWELGKEALRIGDRRQFKQIMTQYLWTKEDIKRWRQSLLTFRALEARRDQMRATAEFLDSIRAMSDSIVGSANPSELVQAQERLEMGIARAQDMENRLSIVLDVSGETVFAPSDLEEADFSERIEELAQDMTDEAEHEESSAFDARIEKGLSQIEEEMRKDL